MKIPSDEYFAGHFDGEGCVWMSKHGKGVRLSIEVKVSSLPTLEMYKLRFGGRIRSIPKCSTNKLLWEWHIHTLKELQIFIDAILPHSIEKSSQLFIARDWLHKRLLQPLRHPSEDFRDFGKTCMISLKEMKKVDHLSHPESSELSCPLRTA